MAVLGNWGVAIIFNVEPDRIYTFQDMSRDVSARWETHDIIAKTPKGEYKGPGQSRVRLTIKLSGERGLPPRRILESLEKCTLRGDVEYLFVGGKKVCKHKMYIESMSEAWDVIMNQGQLEACTLNLTFAEYA